MPYFIQRRIQIKYYSNTNKQNILKTIVSISIFGAYFVATDKIKIFLLFQDRKKTSKSG